AREAQAEARLRQAEANLESVERSASLEVERRYLELTESLEGMAAAERLIDSAAEALRVVREQFENRRALSTAVVDAEQTHRNARPSRQRALAAHVVSRVRYRAATGEDLAP